MNGSIRKRGSKFSYYFSYKDENGKWKTKEKGGFATKKEANSALRAALLAWETRHELNYISDYTFSQFAEYWIESVASKQLKENTLINYRQVIRNHFNPEIGNLKLNKITPIIMQKIFSEKVDVMSASSINTFKIVARRIFEFAIKQKQINENPINFIEVKTKRKKKQGYHAYTLDQLDIVMDAIKDTYHYAPCYISLMTGMRIGEICGLKWKNISFDLNTIKIDSQIQYVEKKLKEISLKSETSYRTIVMTEELKHFLLEHKNKSSNSKFVCLDAKGNTLNPKAVTAKMQRLKKTVDFDCNVHKFRHTHATMLMEQGINIKVIQERLGHSNSSITLDVYSHVSNELERKEMEKFNIMANFHGKQKPDNVIQLKKA